MNVLLVVTGFPDQTNPARSVYNFNYAKELQQSGYKVSVIYLRALKPGRPFLKFSTIDEFNLIEIGCIIPRKGFVFSLITNVIFSKVVKNNKLRTLIGIPNIVHGINGSGAIQTYNVAEYFKCPYLIQFVGSDVNFGLKGKIKDKTYFKALNDAAYFTFNSGRLKIDFFKHFKREKANEIVYRGVKLEKFSFNFIPIKNRVEILFLGGFPNNTNLKGGYTLHQALIELDSKIDVKYPEINVIIGGPLSEMTRNQITLKNISINYLGAIPKENVACLMSQSHIVIIPSLHEGLPNVLYEAMASGNAIICSNVGGIPEFIKNNETGFLFNADNHKQLEKLLHDLLSNKNEIERLAFNSRNYITKFDYSNFLKIYSAIYKKYGS